MVHQGSVPAAPSTLDAGVVPTTARLLDAARTRLQDALCAEGQALAGAREAVLAKGAASVEAADAMRCVLVAHSRSNSADGLVRTLNAQAASD